MRERKLKRLLRKSIEEERNACIYVLVRVMYMRISPLSQIKLFRPPTISEALQLEYSAKV